MANRQENLGALGYLNRIIGEDGIQTDVGVTLSEKTLTNLYITMVGAGVTIIVAYFLAKGAYTKMVG